MTYLVFGTSSIRFFSGFGASIFLPRSRDVACNVPTTLQLALVLIPKSILTELSVLGNTSGKTSTTKLRKYRLAESLIIVTDDGIAGSSLNHKIFSFPVLAYVNFILTNLKSTLCKSSCWQ